MMQPVEAMALLKDEGFRDWLVAHKGRKDVMDAMEIFMGATHGEIGCIGMCPSLIEPLWKEFKGA